MTRIGSLATGYGGLDLAIESVIPGASLAWVADIEPGPRKVLAHRFPDVPNLGDLTRAYWARVEPVDILTAGYPCQPFSHAGRRKGTDDPRHIWPHIATAILALRPRLVFLENVAGHLSSGFGDVLGDLAAIGYDAEWVSLRAADVGACHGRRRVFIAAHPRGETVGLGTGLCAGVSSGLGWGRPHHGAGPAGLLPTPTVRDIKGHNQRRDDTCLTGALLPTPSASNPIDDEDLTTWQDRRERVKASAGNGNGFGTPLGVAVRLMPTPTTDPTSDRWGDYAAAIARHEHLYGPAPEPTEPTGKGGAHRLSPSFAEWMMCLPAGWVTDPAIWAGWTPTKARNAQLKALGNGVVPPQALAALQHMAARHGALTT